METGGTLINVCFIMLSIAMLLTLVRLVRGPSLPDRVIALDLTAMIAVGLIILHSLASGNGVFLDVAIIVALVAFAGTIAFARHVERGARR